jgi:hypothetical protein
VSRVVYRDNIAIDDTGIEDAVLSAVEMYPNPASDMVMVKSELPVAQTMSYELMDASGRSLNKVNRSMQPAGTCLEILPIKQLQLANGIYFLKIQMGTSRALIRPLLVNNQ